MATKSQRARAEQDYAKMAGEPVEVHFTEPEGESFAGGVITVFGSELGMLRIFYRMGGRVEYSKNLGHWYYVSKGLAIVDAV